MVGTAEIVLINALRSITVAANIKSIIIRNILVEVKILIVISGIVLYFSKIYLAIEAEKRRFVNAIWL